MFQTSRGQRSATPGPPKIAEDGRLGVRQFFGKLRNARRSTSDADKAVMRGTRLPMPKNKAHLFRQLFLSNQTPLFNFLRRRVGSEHAPDLLQETFVRALRHEDFAAVTNKPAFLQRIASNLSRDFARRRKVEANYVEFGELPEKVPTEEASPGQGLEAAEKTRLLREAVDSLPPRCREAFVLYATERLPIDEIARRMSVSTNMAQKHIRLALLRCRAALDQE